MRSLINSVKEIKYLPAILFFGWAFLILIFSVVPNSNLQPPSQDDSGFRWDYLQHGGVFFVLSILFGFWKCIQQRICTRKVIMIFAGIGLLYAFFTEVLQLFIESRTFNPLDILFNGLGLILGIGCFWIIFSIDFFATHDET